MTTERQRAMSQAWEKLMRQIESKREQLRRENAKEGRGWSPKKANQLQREIDSLEKRLATTERLADSSP